MKKLLSLIFAVMMAMPIFAANNTMNYQAIINNPDGTPAANREIGMKFLIISDAETLFTEEAKAMSNAQGLVEYEIGSSTANGLAYIDWNSYNIRMEVWVDLNGGTNYTTAYNSFIQSVPKALYAEKSGDTQELWYNLNDLRDFSDKIWYTVEENRKYNDDQLANVRTNLNEIIFRLENLQIGSSEETENRLKELKGEIEYLQKWSLDWFNDLAARIQNTNDSVSKLAKEIANLEIGSGNIDKAELEAKLQYLEASFVDNRALIEELKDRLNSMMTDVVYQSGLKENTDWILAMMENANAETRTYVDMLSAKVADELYALQEQTQAMVAETVAMMEAKVNDAVTDLQYQTRALIDQTAAMVDTKIDAEVADLKTRIEEMAKGLIADYSGLLQNELAKLKDEMKAYVEGYLKEYMEQYMGGIQDSIANLGSENAYLKHEMEWATEQIIVLQELVNNLQENHSSLSQSNDIRMQEIQKENADLKDEVAALKDIVNALQQKVEELSK